MADANQDPDREPAAPEDGSDEDDESLIDEMRGSGVGVEDPHIVGGTEPGIVEEQIQEDQPPEV